MRSLAYDGAEAFRCSSSFCCGPFRLLFCPWNSWQSWRDLVARTAAPAPVTRFLLTFTPPSMTPPRRQELGHRGRPEGSCSLPVFLQKFMARMEREVRKLKSSWGNHRHWTPPPEVSLVSGLPISRNEELRAQESVIANRCGFSVADVPVTSQTAVAALFSSNHRRKKRNR